MYSTWRIKAENNNKESKSQIEHLLHSWLWKICLSLKFQTFPHANICGKTDTLMRLLGASKGLNYINRFCGFIIDIIPSVWQHPIVLSKRQIRILKMLTLVLTLDQEKGRRGAFSNLSSLWLRVNDEVWPLQLFKNIFHDLSKECLELNSYFSNDSLNSLSQKFWWSVKAWSVRFLIRNFLPIATVYGQSRVLFYESVLHMTRWLQKVHWRGN